MIYSRLPEAVDYLGENGGITVYRLKNTLADSDKQLWVRKYNRICHGSCRLKVRRYYLGDSWPGIVRVKNGRSDGLDFGKRTRKFRRDKYVWSIREHKKIFMQLLVVLVLLFGNAEAKGIEAGLGKIGWDADTNLVKKCLEEQGFVLFEQGEEATGEQWQKIGRGQFANFPCNINLIWQGKHLREINIESSEKILLGTNFHYQNLVRRFTDEFGQPSERDKYMLKVFPGIWVESTKWTVAKRGAPTFTVTVLQSNPINELEPGTADMGKINIFFQRVAGNIR